MVIAVAKAACSANTISFTCTGFKPLGYLLEYSVYKKLRYLNSIRVVSVGSYFYLRYEVEPHIESGIQYETHQIQGDEIKIKSDDTESEMT